MSICHQPVPYDGIASADFYGLIKDCHFAKICRSLHEFINKSLLVSNRAAGVNIYKIIRSNI